MKSDSKTTHKQKAQPVRHSDEQHSIIPESAEFAGKEMKETKQDKLHVGESEKMLRNPKQVMPIGLSAARRSGKKVPSPKGGHKAA